MMNSFSYIHRIKWSYEIRYHGMQIIVDICDITERTHRVAVINNTICYDGFSVQTPAYSYGQRKRNN